MMDDQRTQESALVEEMFRQLKVMAESNLAVATKLTEMDERITRRLDDIDVKIVVLTVEVRELKTRVDQLEVRFDQLEARFDRLETRFDQLETRFDQLETRFDGLETRFDRLETRFDKLEAFAADAGPRLERIETHLKLNKPLPARDATRAEPSRHHRRKSAKRT